jgi:hypothetical protein
MSPGRRIVRVDAGLSRAGNGASASNSGSTAPKTVTLAVAVDEVRNHGDWSYPACVTPGLMV